MVSMNIEKIGCMRKVGISMKRDIYKIKKQYFELVKSYEKLAENIVAALKVDSLVIDAVKLPQELHINACRQLRNRLIKQFFGACDRLFGNCFDFFSFKDFLPCSAVASGREETAVKGSTAIIMTQK